MKCRVIKPGFVRRKFGSKVKSVRVEPPEIIEIEGKIPAWVEPIESDVAPAPDAKDEDEGAGGSTPPAADESNKSEAPVPGVELEAINGVGPELREALVSVGIDSLAKFVQAGKDDRAGLIGLPGISEKNVDRFIAEAVQAQKK